MSILQFEHDKVVREWIGADKLGLFIQLEVVENPWQLQGARGGWSA